MSRKTLVLDAFDFKEYLINTIGFIKNPTLVGKKKSKLTDTVSQIDFVRSLFLSIAFLTLTKDLLPNLFEVDPLKLINRTYFMLQISLEAIKFAFGLMICVSAVLIFSERKWQVAVFNQTLRFYSVAIPPYAVIIAIALQRAIVSKSLDIPLNQTDYVVAGIFSLIILSSMAWLLLIPIYQFISSQISRKFIAFIMFIAVAIGSWQIKALLPFDVAGEIVDNKALCKEIYRYKLEKGEIDSSLQISCFLGKCVQHMESAGDDSHPAR